MTPEEYQRFKEAEKEHLRSIRELKRAVKGMERKKRLSDAVQKAVSDPMDALDKHESLVNELAMETARNEAKLDLALESVAGRTSTPDPKPEDEAAIRKARAAKLVEQMRAQMGAATGLPAADTDSAARASTASEGASEAAPANEPSKNKDDEAPLPEKTIGRMNT